VNIVKGARIRVHSEVVYFPALAGMQPKIGLAVQGFVGTVRHLRGDHPTAPTEVRIYADPDDGDFPQDFPTVRPPGCSCPNAHVEVDPKDVVEIL
jgi:hypothetical protein